MCVARKRDRLHLPGLTELLHVVDADGQPRAMQRIELHYDVGELDGRQAHDVDCYPPAQRGDHVMRGDKLVAVVLF